MRIPLVVFGLLFGLLLAEGASRLVERVRCRDIPGNFWEPNPYYGWQHTPDAAGWAQRCLGGKPEWRVYTRINALGLRDRPATYAKPPGFRILVLGDSFMEAIQVELADIFTQRLEANLNDAGDARPPIQVLNAGDSGYGTNNELLFWLYEGWKYRPDLVVLAFNTSNDILENHNGLMRATRFPYPDKPYFELQDGRLVRRGFPLAPLPRLTRLVNDLNQRLARRFALYRLLPPLPPRLVHAAEPPPRPHPGEVFRLDATPAWRDAWRITRGLVLRLRAAVEARGSRFAVVVLNSREEVGPGFWRIMVATSKPLRESRLDRDLPNRLITRFLARRDIEAIPLLEAFRAHFEATGRTGFFPWDVHWNAEGHALAADVVARRLRARGLVPASPE